MHFAELVSMRSSQPSAVIQIQTQKQNTNTSTKTQIQIQAQKCKSKYKLCRVGFYEIEATIGRGNFAVVKLARHRITKTEVKIVAMIVTIITVIIIITTIITTITFIITSIITKTLERLRSPSFSCIHD